MMTKSPGFSRPNGCSDFLCSMLSEVASMASLGKASTLRREGKLSAGQDWQERSNFGPGVVKHVDVDRQEGERDSSAAAACAAARSMQTRVYAAR